jgi:hypothetical protein
MSTTCEMEDSTCCYVWYPRRQEDVPQGIGPHDGSMKLSAKIKTSRFPGKLVKSRVLWTFLKLRHRGRQCGNLVANWSPTVLTFSVSSGAALPPHIRRTFQMIMFSALCRAFASRSKARSNLSLWNERSRSLNTKRKRNEQPLPYQAVGLNFHQSLRLYFRNWFR